MLTILISSKGLSKRSVLDFSIICTTSAPFTTCAIDEYYVISCYLHACFAQHFIIWQLGMAGVYLSKIRIYIRVTEHHRRRVAQDSFPTFSHRSIDGHSCGYAAQAGSIACLTLPNTVCLLSNQGHAAVVVMKNLHSKLEVAPTQLRHVQLAMLPCGRCTGKATLGQADVKCVSEQSTSLMQG